MAMVNGPLAGFEVDAMKITLKDGSYHDVDSDQLSFELAAKLGFKKILVKFHLEVSQIIQICQQMRLFKVLKR